MLLTPHALAGLAIAKAEPSLLPAALAAVTIHFVLDYIPHKDMIGDDHINIGNVVLRITDTIIMLSLFVWLTPPDKIGYYFTILLCSILPDIIELPGLVWQTYRELPGIKQFHHWHTAVLQYSWPKVNWYLGLLPQIILVIYTLWWLTS